MTTAFVVTQADTPLQPVTFEPVYEQLEPRIVVAINGKRYVASDMELTQNAHGATDSATITLPISSNPDFTVELFRGSQSDSNPLSGLNVNAEIDDESPIPVELFFGFPANPNAPPTDVSQLTRIFYGNVDQYAPTFTTDQVVFSARSLGAILVDTKVTRITQNETTQQFVKWAAAQAGLTANIVLSPSAPSITLQEVLGQEFVGGSNYTKTLYGLKIMDLLMQCAQFDDVDVWVDQQQLNYVAPTLLSRTHIGFKYGKDISLDEDCTMTHSPLFNKNISVIVHSYQPKYRVSTSVRKSSDGSGGVNTTVNSRVVTSTPVFGTPNLVTTSVSSDGTSTSTSSTSSGGASGDTTSVGNESTKEKYIFFLRNASPAVVDQFAQSKWRQLSQQEYQLSFSAPITKKKLAQFMGLVPYGPLSALLDVRGLPYLYASGYYYPRQMTWNSGFDKPSTWRFEALNHSLPQGAI